MLIASTALANSAYGRRKEGGGKQKKLGAHSSFLFYSQERKRFPLRIGESDIQQPTSQLVNLAFEPTTFKMCFKAHFLPWKFVILFHYTFMNCSEKRKDACMYACRAVIQTQNSGPCWNIQNWVAFNSSVIFTFLSCQKQALVCKYGLLARLHAIFIIYFIPFIRLTVLCNPCLFPLK